MKKFGLFFTISISVIIICLAIYDTTTTSNDLQDQVAKLQTDVNRYTADHRAFLTALSRITEINSAAQSEENRRTRALLDECVSEREAATAQMKEFQKTIYGNISEIQAMNDNLKEMVQILARDFNYQEYRTDPSKLLNNLAPLVQLRLSYSHERPTSDGRGTMSGWNEESVSGSVIIWNGYHYILTVAHVPKNNMAVEADCYFGDSRPSTTAELVGWSDKLDVAIFKFKNDYHYDGPTLDLGNSDNLKLLSPVATFGSPGALTHGANFSASYGYVMNPNFWSKHHRMSQSSVILHLANSSEGGSGGPLLDINGQIVGVNFGTMNRASFTSDGSGAIVQSKLEMNLFLAIPINDIKKIMWKLVNNKRVRHGQVRGLTLDQSSALSEKQFKKMKIRQPEKNAIVVTDVSKGSLAEKSGFMIGDIIESVNQKELSTQYDFDREVMTQDPGEIAEILISRNDNPITLKVTLNEFAFQLKPIIIK